MSLRNIFGIAMVLALLLPVAAVASPRYAATAQPLFSSVVHASAQRAALPAHSQQLVFSRGFGRMAPAQLRLRLFGPQSLYLQHSTRSRTFAFSWLGGTSSMPCKLQFANGSGGWTDIATTASSPLNCGATAPYQSITLNSDGWKSNWNGTQIRIVRISDSAVLGTFSQTLSCNSTSGSSSATPTIDEDCNGTWDNFVAGTATFTRSSNGVWYSGYVQCNPRCGGVLTEGGNCYFELRGGGWDSIGSQSFDDNLNPPSGYPEWASCVVTGSTYN